MKKYLLLGLIGLFFITCKKNQPPAPTNTSADLVGKWSLISTQWVASTGTGFTAAATQYPCMVENILQLNADNTSSTTYLGTDSCYITAVRGNGNITEGIPGQAAYKSTWKRNGNVVYLGKAYSLYSQSNGKSYLTITDTISSTLVIISVDVKQ